MQKCHGRVLGLRRNMRVFGISSRVLSPNDFDERFVVGSNQQLMTAECIELCLFKSPCDS